MSNTMKYTELQVKLILNSCGVSGFPKYLLAECELISFTKFVYYLLQF